MAFIIRTDKGKLQFQRLDYQILIDETLGKAKTPEEMQWIYDQLKGNLEGEFENIMENDHPDFEYEV